MSGEVGHRDEGLAVRDAHKLLRRGSDEPVLRLHGAGATNVWLQYTVGRAARGGAVELKDILAGKTPEEQTAWLQAHMPTWDEFVQGIVQSRQQLAEWRAAGNPGLPPTWISVEEYRKLRGLPAKPH